MNAQKITIETEEIQLDQFLKWAGVLSSGGELKPLIAEGLVYLNGEKESARRRKLHAGDRVEIKGMGVWEVAR